MIHEYALEPELVASWHDPVKLRLLAGMFGLGTGRVVSRYPKNWSRTIWESLGPAFGASIREIQKKRFEEFLKRLKETEVRRHDYIWEDTRSWLENAEGEHDRCPFHSIIARTNPRNVTHVMSEESLADGTGEGWDVPNSIAVQRTASSMANAVKPMLCCADLVVFVDPHFRASRLAFRKPLSEFLSIIAAADRGSSQVTVELHTGNITCGAPDWNHFRSECERHLGSVVPVGLSLVIKRWKNRENGERLHNRYILTDKGGVEFGVGLDEGDSDTTDDISLLGEKAFYCRLRQYYLPGQTFELEGEVTIMGTS